MKLNKLMEECKYMLNHNINGTQFEKDTINDIIENITSKQNIIDNCYYDCVFTGKENEYYKMNENGDVVRKK